MPKPAPEMLSERRLPDGTVERVYASRTRGTNVKYRCTGKGGAYTCNCGGERRAKTGRCVHDDDGLARDKGASAAAVYSVSDNEQPITAATIQRPPAQRRRQAMTTSQAVVPHTPQMSAPAEMQPMVLQRPPSRIPPDDVFNMMMKIAGAVVGAANQPGAERMVPVNIKTPEQALAIMLAGYDRGMPPTVSLARVFIVNGRCEFDAQALMGIVRDWDETAYFQWFEYSREVASVRLWRGGREASPICTYDVKDAKDSGQWWKGARLKVKAWKKVRGRDGQERNVPAGYELDANGEPIIEEPGVWQNYTRDMLMWKAITRACRLGASDALNQIDTGKHPQLAPAQRYAIEEIEQMAAALPASPLQKALNEGKVTPQQVFAGEGPDNDVRAEEDEAPEETPLPFTSDDSPAIVSTFDPDEADVLPDAVEDAPVEDAPADAQEPAGDPQAPFDREGCQRATIAMYQERVTWDKQARALLEIDVKTAFPEVVAPGGVNFRTLTDARILECYEWLAKRTGVPPA